jgi:hypothetical protein
MTLETFRGDNSELLDSVTIKHSEEFKDKSFGNVLKRVLYKVVEVIGWVYTKIDYLVRDIQNLKEDGGLFGKKKLKF